MDDRSPAPQDAHWYKDVVVYQLHVKSFFDANNDGTGDFPGLTAKLDYLRDLGVDAIWLMPFYPSPQRDDGYDIADYRGINPQYGTTADFDWHNAVITLQQRELAISAQPPVLETHPHGQKQGLLDPVKTQRALNLDFHRSFFLRQRSKV